ncbi:MAG: hypothetical protein A2Z88_09595 [Omnitrophica WOR_2 bacterium GWA2_47_8]|nr:MAG: hypothetical protein A2Z88_09595 [Omnitrophica WOR_2 bacterium GWA2_47_8]
MKRKLFVFGLLVLLSGLSASLAMACNCGKKVNGNQAASCQCASGCGGQSACSDDSFQLAQGVAQDESNEGESKAVEVGNKICPVSGEKVGEMGEIIKHEYNGKIYNFCCKMCIKDFKNDPEKYIKKLEAAEAAGSADADEHGH